MAGAVSIVVASGCQVLSGISSLDATGGSGTTSTAASTSKSSSASGGMCSMPPASVCAMPACPGMCSGLTCAISCGGSSSSPSCGGNVTCGPTNQGDCTFHCTGTGCQNKTIQCPTNGHVCNVDCADANACAGTTIQCGDGPCNVSCGMMACVDQGPIATKVDCGGGACLVTCNQSAAPMVNQGKACLEMVTGCGMGSTTATGG